VTHTLLAAWTCVVLALAVGCDRKDSKAAAAAKGGPGAPAQSSAPDLGHLRVDATERVVAIGDLHGDGEAARRALRVAGVLDEAGHWSGGKTTVVQTGDQLDRGDDEPEILELLDRLANEAEEAGGHVRVLNGNHETMNVLLDFRYVTPEGFADFDEHASSPAIAPPVRALVEQLPDPAKGRGAAFAPGGPLAMKLATRPITLVVGDTAFAHGGILPKHVAYGLPKMDREVKGWMRGEIPRPPAAVTDEDAPVWTRAYGAAPGAQDCTVLAQALDALGARRMVVGHTVQKQGISPACDDRLWRIDTGMAEHYGGPTQVLQIVGDTVTVLE
jgi:hypothetical protein